MTTREEYFQYIQDLNDQITKLMAIRNTAEIECIKEGRFTNWQAFNATYLRWQRKEGEYREPTITVI